MRILKIAASVALLLLVSGLVYMLIDAAVSLDYSRSQNQSLQKKCRQLSMLVSEGLRGKSAKDLIAKNEPSAIVKRDGPQLRINDVVLHIENDKVVEVIISETCE